MLRTAAQYRSAMGVFDWLRSWWASPPSRTARKPSPDSASPPSTLGPGRTSGRPPSGNGASSFHLLWDLAGEFAAVSVDFEVLRAPQVDKLYFWALQANFTDRSGRDGGGAHFGLQFHPDYPGSTAVNWGGYGPGGGELDGSSSPLAGSLGNPHTRDYAWQPRRRYRFRIDLAPPEHQPGDGRTAWRGSVTDTATDATTAVRVLYTRGDRLRDPIAWSEVFAHCDHPEVAVRWSGFEATDFHGVGHRPEAIRLNYQAHDQGGCANTDSEPGPDGSIVQRTNVARAHAQGSRIRIGSASS